MTNHSSVINILKGVFLYLINYIQESLHAKPDLTAYGKDTATLRYLLYRISSVKQVTIRA